MAFDPSADERAPLLQFPGQWQDQPSRQEVLGDHHSQFCHLVGMRPLNFPPGTKYKPLAESLYLRAKKHHSSQRWTYYFTATMTNTLLLTQVVLGASLTGLGASNSSPILITVFGALNTIIAGVIAFLKSRGQPMRARMFRDDLERVVDEIENSAIMWLGIARNVHGYDAIDTDEQVTVRSEVARLTRLYDRAVKHNTLNDPDFYNISQGVDGTNAGLKARPATANPALTPQPEAADAPAPAPAPVPAAQAVEEVPTSKVAEPGDADSASQQPTPAASGAADGKASSAASSVGDADHQDKDLPAPVAKVTQSLLADPDESPASSARPLRRKDSGKEKK